MRRVSQAEHRRAIALLHRLADKAVQRALRQSFAPLLARVQARQALTASALNELDGFSGAWVQAVQDELLPMIEETFGLGALGAARQLRDAVAARTEASSLTPLQVQVSEARKRWLAQSEPRWFKLGDEVWGKAKAQLLEGITLGEGTDLLAARLESVAELATPLANSVARSESIASANAGSTAEVRALGEHGPAGRVWIATNDPPRVRREHLDAHGQVVALDEPFEVGGELLDFPGDPNGSAEMSMNCRCTVGYTETVPAEGEASPPLEHIMMEVPIDTEAIAAAAQPCGCDAAHDCGCAGVVTAAAEVHTGGMVALVPTEADAQRLAVDGYEPAEVLHATLAFLGDSATMSAELRGIVLSAAEQLAADTEPIIANAHGVALFNAASDEPCETYLIGDVDLVATPLAGVHELLWDALADLGDVFPEQHSPHVPHIAVAYPKVGVHGTTAGSASGHRKARTNREMAVGDDIDAVVSGNPLSAESPSTRQAIREGGPGGWASVDHDAGHLGGASGSSVEGGGGRSSPVWEHQVHRTITSGGEDPIGSHTRAQAPRGVLDSQPAVREADRQAEWVPPTDMQAMSADLSPSLLRGQQGENQGRGHVPLPRSGIQGTPGVLASGRTTSEEGSTHELLSALDQAGTDVTFDRIRVAFGTDEVTDFPLSAGTVVASEEEAMSTITDEQARNIGEQIGTAFATALSTATTTGTDSTVTLAVDAAPAPAVDAPAPDDAPADTAPADAAPEEFHILMVTEEQATLEKPSRFFMADCFEWREPPFPLMWLNTDTHSEGAPDPSVQVALITRVERQGLELHAWGHWDDPVNEDAAEARRRVENGMLQWNSVDIGDVGEADIELVFPPPGTLAPDGIEVMEPEQVRFHHGRFVLSTLVFAPAQENAIIEPLIFADGSTEAPAPESDEQIAIAAAAYPLTIPDVPDASWFTKPPLEALRRGAFTITDEGRIYGLLAPGAVPHVGLAERTTVPLRNVDYRDFLRGETPVRLADGTVGRIVTGNLTMACGHAERTLPNGATASHYDNSCSLFATAVCGEAHGDVWIAGALLPGVNPDQVRRAMACQLSGHWNPHELARGRYSLLAGLLVPIPGFPKGRTEATATSRWGPNDDGDLMLVASAVPVVFEQTTDRPVLAPVAERIARSVGLDRRSRALALADRVKGGR